MTERKAHSGGCLGWLRKPEKFFRHCRWRYQWRYFWGNTPWEVVESPPEVHDFIKTMPPGKALDLGCGTGTHAMILARHGWDVTGVDFASGAVRAARAKADKSGLRASFIHADVTRSSGLGSSFDFALDIGCLFALRNAERERYAERLPRLLRSGAMYMLFAWLPRGGNGEQCGISPETVNRLFCRSFSRSRIVVGEEKGRASAWYWYRRR